MPAIISSAVVPAISPAVMPAISPAVTPAISPALMPAKGTSASRCSPLLIVGAVAVLQAVEQARAHVNKKKECFIMIT
jgi:hypothetical protein